MLSLFSERVERQQRLIPGRTKNPDLSSHLPPNVSHHLTLTDISKIEKHPSAKTVIGNLVILTTSVARREG